MYLNSRQIPFSRRILAPHRFKSVTSAAQNKMTAGLPALFGALVLTCELMCATLMAAAAAPLADDTFAGRQLAALWWARPFVDSDALRLAQSVSSELLESAPQRLIPQRQINKKSESPQWEDLGWAWGKRSAPPLVRLRYFVTPSVAGLTALRAYGDAGAMVKKTPDWHDLGWAWGRRK